MSVLVGTPVAAVVGVAVALAAGAVFDSMGQFGRVGFWGAVDGVVAALVAFTLTLAVTGRRAATRRFGWYTAGVVLLASSGAVSSFDFAWRVPPTTLEGAWLWPLMLVTLGAALASFRRGRRGART